jgi:endogenous inhibitor of DNA gyrase (YacG/DUF329 family)
MRIIKPGKVNSPVYEGTCPLCGAMVECYETELGRWFCGYYVICPTEGCKDGRGEQNRFTMSKKVSN